MQFPLLSLALLRCRLPALRGSVVRHGGHQTPHLRGQPRNKVLISADRLSRIRIRELFQNFTITYKL